MKTFYEIVSELDKEKQVKLYNVEDTHISIRAKHFLPELKIGETRFVSDTTLVSGVTLTCNLKRNKDNISVIVTDCCACEGTGEIECPECDGTGNVECYACEHEHDCEVCYGWGKVDCSICGGVCETDKNDVIFEDTIDLNQGELFNNYIELYSII